ncbi:uL11 family ribosomal protein [Pseudonocardia humida]|uniref:Large ribosomal subunit protein uL11 n=1 Tax=Pseudonocardia humida TaxID=2800819 RepID=A0ABT1A4G4_9PSEU|nr:50S ribosomal protein L11 [Pseudonocardia humida]MCO1657896.1 50S ribosomal protein L11 [Pseudonocardia humida]
MPPKRPIHQVTLQLTAGAAAVTELGKMLGQTGVNLVGIKRHYDELTAARRGDVVPARITVFDDRSFALELRTPPTSFLIRRALGGPGSARPAHAPAGTLTAAQLREVAERKLPDLNTDDIEKAMRIVAGTARSMGVLVEA